MTRKILIVEDDPDIAENLKELLEIEGYEADIAYNGDDALRNLRGNSPGPRLVLLDLMMPVMDGFQFYEAKKRDETLMRIPVIVMTAGASAEAAVQQLGADAYFQKPLDLDRLLSTIDKLTRTPPHWQLPE